MNIRTTTKTLLLTVLASLGFAASVDAQPVPGTDENIPYLMTFGKNTTTEWGDDNFIQIIFFSIPTDFTQPIYIRVFDPDCGGQADELNGSWNTKTRFSVYGGVGSCSNKDAQKCNENGDYDSGTQLASKVFGMDAQYDGKWYTFGPFNPSEGENLPEFGGRVFKVVVEGIAGDDGNMYRFYLSRKQNDNVKVDGAFAYYFKYKFRMYDDASQISHIYPYIDDKVISLKQSNFDWDSDGILRIISCTKNGIMMKVSTDNVWATSTHKIDEGEKNTSWDIQMIKSKAKPLKNNNVVIYLENQYGELLPFYSVPIGGVPKYNYNIKMKQSPKK
ncbi:MAG: hypothetical protein HUJ96_10765 [Marinilabiliaceae bacterium]|nr:hypothetical protein [Marinilabiliaceae bacterium]